MVNSSHHSDSYLQPGFLLAPVFLLLIIIISSSNTTPSSNLLNTGDAKPHSYVAGVLDAEISDSKAENEAVKDDEKASVSKSASACITTALYDEISADHYLRYQLIQNIDGTEEVCAVNNDFTVVVTTGATCKAYPGKDGQGATPKCPTAVVYKDNDGKVNTICWDWSETTCSAAATNGQQTASTDNAEQSEWMKNLKQLYPDAIDASYDAKLTEATDVVFESGNNQKPAPVRGAQSDVLDVKSAPVRNAQTTVGSDQSGTVTRNTLNSQSINTSNPVTAAQGTNATQLSGAGISPTNGGYQPTSGQSRFQSFQRPQLFQPTSNIVSGNNQSSQQPSVVERFARFLGADQRLFSRQSPQGYSYNTPYEQRAPQTTFIISSQDAEIKSIQEIASEVAQYTTTNGSRVDNFAQTLNIVGGPSTTGRNATTINSAYGTLQDLIVEDEAIRAMFVAEQTAKRAKNRVFCVEAEMSDACAIRRNEAAKRVERQTFVEELEKRNLPQPALEHFLAVYDGWVNPSTSVPKSKPVALSGALTNSTQTATSTSFAAWAWGGVKSSAQKMLDALAAWLTL